MRRHTLMVAIVIAGITGSSVAMAEPPWEDQYNGPPGHHPHHDGPDRHGAPRYERHHGPERWVRGDHLDRRYYDGPRYQVRDWRERDLPPPPRGQRWLEIDGRYVLAAVAGGVITAIIMNH